jgi:hypothetical protein
MGLLLWQLDFCKRDSTLQDYTGLGKPDTQSDNTTYIYIHTSCIYHAWICTYPMDRLCPKALVACMVQAAGVLVRSLSLR